MRTYVLLLPRLLIIILLLAWLSEITAFNSSSLALVEVLDVQAKSIEAVKLKAIGKRNRVATMRVEKRRSQRELQAPIEEKQNELDRYKAEHHSLVRVAQEQEALIQKLSCED